MRRGAELRGRSRSSSPTQHKRDPWEKKVHGRGTIDGRREKLVLLQETVMKESTKKEKRNYKGVLRPSAIQPAKEAPLSSAEQEESNHQ